MAKKNRHPKKNTGMRGDVGRSAAQLAADRDASEAAYRDVLDRSKLHPSLRGLGEDDNVPVIITTGSGGERPDDAGDLLGELNQDMITESGKVIAAGSKVWRDTRPAEGRELPDRLHPSMAGEQIVAPPVIASAKPGPGRSRRLDVETGPVRDVASLPDPSGHLVPDPGRRPAGMDPATAERVRAGAQAQVPAAFIRNPGVAFHQALEADQPGLTQRLYDGLSPKELQDPDVLNTIARAASGAGPGRYSVVQGGTQGGTMPAKVIIGGKQPGVSRDLPGGLRAGDIIAAGRPAGYQAAGIPLPDGYTGDPGDQVWRPLAAVPEGGPELIVTDDLDKVDAANTDLVIEDLDPQDEDDSGRVLMGSPATVRGWHDRMEAADKRGARLIPGTADSFALARSLEAAEAIGLRENWSAADVLLAHEWLAKHYRDPSSAIADYLAFHIRNSLEQDHKTASMFWPLDLSKGADVPEGTKMARLIARGLGEAGTIQVTARMCRKMSQDRDAAAGLGLVVLDEGLLPVPAGFAWLDAPWLSETSAGYWLPVRAVSWERITVLAASTVERWSIPAGSQGTPIDAVRIVLWLRIPDDVSFGRWKGHERRALKVANQVGNLVPQQIVILPFGVRVNLGERFRTNGRELMTLLHILWKTLGETIPKSRPVRTALPGGPRQAARRTLRHDGVHIVTLREYSYDSDPVPGHPRAVDWQWRWWTEKFYRHIDHYEDGTDSKGRNRRHKPVPAAQPGLLPDDDHDVCAVCLANGQTVRISYVAGFWKGPPGRPLKPPATDQTVYRLAR